VSAETTSMQTSGSAEIYRALTNDDIVAVDVSGTVAYGVTYDTDTESVDLIAVNISTPSSPLEISRVTWTQPLEQLSRAYDIVVAGDTALVSVEYWNPVTYEIVAFDISDPE